MLRLRTSSTTKRIRATVLVPAATLEGGIRDFLFEAFLHVAGHDRPPLATPDSESPPPRGRRIWVLPIDWGRHLVGQPVSGRVDINSDSRYLKPDMAHPPTQRHPQRHQRDG